MYPTQRSRYIGSDLLTSVDRSELCIETCVCHLTASLLLKLGRCLMDRDRLERELSLRCPQHPSHQVNLAQIQKQASRTSSVKGDALLVFKPSDNFDWRISTAITSPGTEANRPSHISNLSNRYNDEVAVDRNQSPQAATQPEPVRRSTRIINAPDRYGEWI